ncbi:MAG: hypothetical protein AB7O88_03625 [Reyranellaceae bacterium]
MKVIRFAGVAFALALAACGLGMNVGVYSVDKPVPADVQSAGVYQIEAYINQALTTKGWKADKIKPGELRATQEWDNKVAVITILYSQQRYSISLHSSLNLDEGNGRIDNQYNIRVRQLEYEIDGRMRRAG